MRFTVARSRGEMLDTYRLAVKHIWQYRAVVERFLSTSVVPLKKCINECKVKYLSDAADDARSGVAEGCILCAEQFVQQGQRAEAAELCDKVRQAKVSQQRVLEATRGAIIARGNDGIPLLVEQIRSPDVKQFQMALGTARELPGSEVDKALAAELADAPADRATLIVHAMADRIETIDLSTMLRVAKSARTPRVAKGSQGLPRVAEGLPRVWLRAHVHIVVPGPRLRGVKKAVAKETV